MRVIKLRLSTVAADADRGEWVTGSQVWKVNIYDSGGPAVVLHYTNGNRERFRAGTTEIDTFIQAWVNIDPAVVVAELVYTDRTDV